MNLRIALALLLAGGAPARAEVVTKADNGFNVRVAAHVTAKPAEAWKTIVAPSLWWQAQHTFSGDAANLVLDPVPGGCFCERLPLPKDATKGERAGGVQHMRVLYAEPGKALRLSGALGPLQSEAVQGTLTITIKPTETGSRIVFDYVVGGYMRYPVAEIAPAVDKVMAAQLASLATKLGPVAAKPAPEQPPERLPEPAPAEQAPSAPAVAGPQATIAPSLWSLPPGAGSKSAAARPPAARPVPAAAVAAPARIAAKPVPEVQTSPGSASANKPAPAKPALAKPAPAKPVAAKPAPSASAAATRPAAAKSPSTKPVVAKPAAARPADREHEDANAAFDALLGNAPQ